MSVRTLLGHAWRRHRVLLAWLALGLFVFEWLITRLAPTGAEVGAIQQLIQLLPPALMQMFGNEMMANLHPLGALSFGYAHPFAIVLPAAWAVRVSAASLAGEIGNGTLSLLAARPVSRHALVASGLIMLAFGLAVIAGMGWAGTATGLASRPALGLDAGPFVRVATTQWLLFMAFGTIGLLVSATRRAGGQAIGITSAIIAVSFALDYIARAWAPVKWLHPASLFGYFHPQKLAAEGFSAGDLLPLAITGVVASVLSFVIFGDRDL